MLTCIENKICLGLIDSIHDDPFRWIELSNRAFLNEPFYLLAHGHQFESKNAHHLITGWWDVGKALSGKWKRIVTSTWTVIKDAFGKRDYSRFYENITTSNENNDVIVTHIVFGHTHKHEIKDVSKINTGCWLEDTNPSFLAIYIDGNYDLFVIQ